jgi:hypothetical protein
MTSKPAVKPRQTPLEYCRQLANLIGLTHWRIDLEPGDPDDDALASMRVISGQQRAMLKIGRGYTADTPEDQRSTMLHELIHVHLWPCDDVIEAVGPLLGTAAANLATSQHNLAVERATDSLAVAIAEHFPLPAP